MEGGTVAIIQSDEAKDRLVEVIDTLGRYYYLGDDTGDITVDGWSDEETARAAWDCCGEADYLDHLPETDVDLDSRGCRLVECAYCGRKAHADIPAVDDDEAWEALAAEHADDCEWVATRAHRRELA